MTPGVVVPDHASWTMWGRDPAELGIVRAPGPEQARQLLLPDPVPEALVEPVRSAWARMPPPRRYVGWPRSLPGVPASEVLAPETDPSGEAHHGGHDMEHGDHEMDHGDMMAIVGDPSEDGLVMESIDFELGPLDAGVPGGLALTLSLDGDVIDRCEPRATLAMPLGPIAGGALCDPLAPVSWATAIALALELAAGRGASEATARIRLAAVESERALSHLAWLRAFGHLLGWAELEECADDAALAVMPHRMRLEEAAATLSLESDHRGEPAAGLEAASRPVDRVRRLLDGSRRLAARTRGRAEVTEERIAADGVAGPVARAAGASRDARTGDALYETLGFREIVLEAGDAEARTLLRSEEAAAALDLARVALHEKGAGGAATTTGEAVVEGPRGPIHASAAGGQVTVRAPGSPALLTMAGEAVAGLEVGAALTALASFDLSGWRVSE